MAITDKRGFLIVQEGCDISEKTAQDAKLVEKLNNKGKISNGNCVYMTCNKLVDDYAIHPLPLTARISSPGHSKMHKKNI